MVHFRKAGLAASACILSLAALAGAVPSYAYGATPDRDLSAPAVFSADTIVIRGVVMDRQQGTFLEGVSIRLTGPGGEERVVLTDAEGEFGVGPLPAGEYLLEAQHLGYRDAETVVYPTGEDDLELVLGLVPEPVELEPIVATRGPQVSSDLRAFHERMLRGVGQYLSQEDIERLDPHRATDALEHMPALQAESTGGRAGTGRILFRGRCPPEVFVDGVRSAAGAHEVDEMVSSQDLYGVEVHGPSTAPSELNPRRPCGVVAIWTKPGGGPGHDPSFERSVVAFTVLGLFLVLF